MKNIEKRLALLESSFLILCDHLVIKRGDIVIDDENRDLVNALLEWCHKVHELNGFIHNFKEDGNEL